MKNTHTADEVFTPMVDWITVRMLFALGVVENWQTASIDFKNAFTQAKLPKPLHLELPPGLQHANPGHKDKVIQVNTSLCGDVRSADLWHKKIAKTLSLCSVDLCHGFWAFPWECTPPFCHCLLVP